MRTVDPAELTYSEVPVPQPRRPLEPIAFLAADGREDRGGILIMDNGFWAWKPAGAEGRWTLTLPSVTGEDLREEFVPLSRDESRMFAAEARAGLRPSSGAAAAADDDARNP